jgi:hypothetical protein
MKLWRNQRCHFCTEPLINFRRIITQDGTGWKLHLECDNKIQELKRNSGKSFNDKIYRSLTYVECIRDKRGNSKLVYQ